MSSASPSFVSPSPLTPSSSTVRRRKSRFTYRHLSQLISYTTTCPLRVIAHIDLDAFYAQCEMIRLGIPEDQPLAVQQWGSFIAINYPARKFGLGRFATAVEAQKVCPTLIMQHVATWKEGEETWAYHDDAVENVATHKVALDPYRMQSRKILALIKELVPAPPFQRVEKASVDEVFLDLSAHVHSILLQRYPDLNTPAPYDDPSENLPRPPTTALDWAADAVVDLDDTETEDDDPDWDDVAMLIGSEIVRSIRASIREKLQYTCSAGIAQNKMLAKLGSGHNKPNRQTIVRNRAVQQFLSGFKFTKIRSLGGKLGDEIVSQFGHDTVTELLKVPIEQLKKKLGNDTGTWVHQIVRGVDHSEVNPRTQIKSMLSAKSFRPTITTYEQATRWLRIFAADIFSRLVEEGVLDNRRRPKTMNLHHRRWGQTKARSTSIPAGRGMDEALLFDLSKNLLIQIIAEGDAWPCANLSLSVSGFEDGITGNRKIGSFLVTGQDAVALKSSSSSTGHIHPSGEPLAPFDKRRKIDNGGIQKFFRKNTNESETEEGDHVAEDGKALEREVHMVQQSVVVEGVDSTEIRPDVVPTAPNSPEEQQQEEEGEQESTAGSYVCGQCDRTISIRDKAEHEDWHLAEVLQREERRQSALYPTSTAAGLSIPLSTTTPPPASALNSSSSMISRLRDVQVEKRSRSNPSSRSNPHPHPHPHHQTNSIGTSNTNSNSNKMGKGQRRLMFSR